MKNKACNVCGGTSVTDCDKGGCGALSGGIRSPEPMPAEVPGSFNDLAALVPERDPTPGHRWEGGEDPHKGHYDGTRDDLTLGDFTDDELANYAFLKYDQPFDIGAIMSQDPGYHAPIVIMTGVKDRLRWLTRQLDKRDAELSTLHRQIALAAEQIEEQQAAGRRMAGIAEDLLERLVNVTEGSEDPVTDEEISEIKEVLGLAEVRYEGHPDQLPPIKPSEPPAGC